MSATDFIDYYNGLPTKADQKELRKRILKECKVKKPTFYSWLSRGDVPDEKALTTISNIVVEFQVEQL